MKHIKRKRLVLIIGLTLLCFWVSCTNTVKKVPPHTLPLQPIEKPAPQEKEKPDTIPTEPLEKTPDKKNILEEKKQQNKEEAAIPKDAEKTISITPQQKTHQPLPVKPKPILRLTTSKKHMVFDAGKTSKIVVYVTNEGQTTETDMKVCVSGFEDSDLLESNAKPGIEMNIISPGEKKKVVIPIRIKEEIESRTLHLTVTLSNNNIDNNIGKNIEQNLILTIKATCRSQEDVIFAAINKKSTGDREKQIDLCQSYIKNYSSGRYTEQVTNRLEDERWHQVRDIYTKTIEQGTEGSSEIQSACEKIKQSYLNYYGLEGRYSMDVARIFHELREFHQACMADTYEEWEKFLDNHPTSTLAGLAKERTTLKYWRERYAKEPNAENVWCQLAQALVAEKGSLGCKEAEALYLKVLERDNRNEVAYIGLGNIYKSGRSWDRCILYLAQRRPPEVKHHRIFYLLGHAYERKDNQTMAFNMYTKAIEDVLEEIHEKINNINRCPYLDKKIKTQAIKQLKKTPEYLDYLYYRALIYREFIDYANAEKDFKKIISLAPSSRQAEMAKKYLQVM